MAFQHQEGRGRLFANAKKDNDRQPDFRGDALFNGELVEIAGWWREQDISISIKRKADVADKATARFSRHEDEPLPHRGLPR